MTRVEWCVRRIWRWTLVVVCCGGGVVCRAQEQPADVLKPSALPNAVTVFANPPTEAQVIKVAIEEPSPPAGVPQPNQIRFTPATVGEGPGGLGLAFSPNAQVLTVLVGAEDAVQVEPGKYWIGLLCVDPGEALRAQLGLGEGVGLLVEAVTDDSPAKKAGILPHDVLVTANLSGDKADETVKVLKQVKDLVDIVQASETRVMHLERIRKGQREVVALTPAERPKPDGEAVRVVVRDPNEQTRLPAGVDPSLLLNWERQGLRLAGPLFAYQLKTPPLPEGMSMEFRQVVGHAETITIKKGDEKWEVTEAELDKLPAEVRAVVMQQVAARRAGSMSAGPGYGVHAWQAIPPAVPASPNTPPTTGGKYGVTTTKEGVANYLTVTGAAPVVWTTVAVSLPDDVTVSVVRKGSEPAKVSVKRGEQTWEATEKELDKLPEDLRKHAETALRGHIPQPVRKTWTARVAPTPSTTAVPSVPSIVVGPPSAAEHHRVTVEAQQREQHRKAAEQLEQARKQLDQQREQLEIREQLKQLNDKIEKLQQALEKSAPKQ